MTVSHRSTGDLENGLAEVLQSGKEVGIVMMIVRRPEPGTREVLDEARLDPRVGLEGDNWSTRGSRHTPDGSAEPGKQITLMSARVAALVAGPKESWPLAGDQLYVDLDLSEENLPIGSRLKVGEAVVELTGVPHGGCRKFTDRFGVDATRFVNSERGMSLRLRGANARVVEAGVVRTGDTVRKHA